MWRPILVVLAAWFTAAPVFAASWGEALFDELGKDFGTVPQGPELQHFFHLKNNTGSVLTISGIRVSCGRCGGASFAKSQLNPGEETTILGRMYTTNFVGPKTIWIYVQISQPQFEEVRLWVQCNSRSDVTMNPDTLAFGQVKQGTRSSASTLITLNGNSQTQITEVDTSSDTVKTTIKETQRTDTQVTYQLTATLDANLKSGNWWGEIWMKTTDPALPRLRVPLTVNVEPALNVTPAVLTFGQVAVGKSTDRKVIVRSTQPFKIREVRGTSDQLSVVELPSDSKTVHVVVLRWRAAKGGPSNCTVEIVTNLHNDATIDFQAKAEIVP
jgi:hypothetical protein